MVRYVILRRFLREIPPSISIFRQFRPSAWLTPKRRFLHGVDTPDLATWSPNHEKETFHDDETAATDISEDASISSLDKEKDSWPEAEADSGDYPPLVDQPGVSDHNTRHDTGHITPGTRPSDTCPYTCTILNQNVNGLGGSKDDKLEKIISLMIERISTRIACRRHGSYVITCSR